MGDYTGLRFDAKLNNLGMQIIGKLLYGGNPDPGRNCDWQYIADLWNQHEWLVEWATKDRSNFIPFGAMSYMPDDWIQEAMLADNVWHVCCSLKNYNGEIEQFLMTVLPHLIAEPVNAETLYEYWEESQFQVVKPDGWVDKEVVAKPRLPTAGRRRRFRKLEL